MSHRILDSGRDVTTEVGHRTAPCPSVRHAPFIIADATLRQTQRTAAAAAAAAKKQE
jgi:hypothetical protein